MRCIIGNWEKHHVKIKACHREKKIVKIKAGINKNFSRSLNKAGIYIPTNEQDVELVWGPASNGKSFIKTATWLQFKDLSNHLTG